MMSPYRERGGGGGGGAARGLAGLGVTGYNANKGPPPRTLSATTHAQAQAFKSLNSAKHTYYTAGAGAGVASASASASPYAQPQPRPTTVHGVGSGGGGHRAWSARPSSTERPGASSSAGGVRGGGGGGGGGGMSGADATRLDYRVMGQHRDASYRRDAEHDAAAQQLQYEMRQQQYAQPQQQQHYTAHQQQQQQAGSSTDSFRFVSFRFILFVLT